MFVSKSGKYYAYVHPTNLFWLLITLATFVYINNSFSLSFQSWVSTHIFLHLPTYKVCVYTFIIHVCHIFVQILTVMFLHVKKCQISLTIRS